MFYVLFCVVLYFVHGMEESQYPIYNIYIYIPPCSTHEENIYIYLYTILVLYIYTISHPALPPFLRSGDSSFRGPRYLAAFRGVPSAAGDAHRDVETPVHGGSSSVQSPWMFTSLMAMMCQMPLPHQAKPHELYIMKTASRGGDIEPTHPDLNP